MINAPLGQETQARAAAEIRRIVRRADLAYRAFIICCVLIGLTVLALVVWLWRV